MRNQDFDLGRYEEYVRITSFIEPTLRFMHDRACKHHRIWTSHSLEINSEDQIYWKEVTWIPHPWLVGSLWPPVPVSCYIPLREDNFPFLMIIGSCFIQCLENKNLSEMYSSINVFISTLFSTTCLLGIDCIWPPKNDARNTRSVRGTTEMQFLIFPLSHPAAATSFITLSRAVSALFTN